MHQSLRLVHMVVAVLTEICLRTPASLRATQTQQTAAEAEAAAAKILDSAWTA